MSVDQPAALFRFLGGECFPPPRDCVGSPRIPEPLSPRTPNHAWASGIPERRKAKLARCPQGVARDKHPDWRLRDYVSVDYNILFRNSID